MALIAIKKKKKKVKKAPTPEQKREAARLKAFEDQHRAIFLNCGFERLRQIGGKHFEFEGVRSEIDDIFIFENVVVIAEYTLSNAGNLGGHAKTKAGSNNKIVDKPYEFLEELAKLSPHLKQRLEALKYSKNQLIFRLIYGSDPAVENHHRAFFSSTMFLSRAERTYFKKLAQTLKKSARYELFDFLSVPAQTVGSGGVISANTKTDRYHGSLLPEEHSNFPSGFRIASFYIDPEALLKRAYVLRRSGWKDSANLYQRMIISKKISGIRTYLREQHRVFANNVVITLPDDTEFRRDDDTIIDATKISVTTPAWAHIKDLPNTVGVVDGQHRVFSYYEDLKPDELIDHYRKQQNLLVTGIVYPKGTSALEKEQFEASLFLEINSNQSGAKSDLKQAIWLMLDPFRPISVARTVANRLAAVAPLNGILERTVYDEGRLPTTTIVSYGILPLVKRSGKDSIFAVWQDSDKAKIIDGSKDFPTLERYLQFSVSHIADFLSLCRDSLSPQKWKIAEKGTDGILSVTAVNSLIILMRKLIEAGLLTHAEVKVELAGLNAIDFRAFKSSQYAALASALFDAVTAPASSLPSSDP